VALPVRQYEGFTLMELLVAMTLMVVVGSCLYTALHTGFRAYRSALLAAEPTSQAMNAIELIKQDLQGILPPESNGLAVSFIGEDSTGLKGVDADSVEFYTTHVYADDESLSGGLGKVELLLEEDKDAYHDNYTSYQLVRQVTMNLLAPKEVNPEEQVLCRNVLSLNLRYFDGDDWLDEWDSTDDANSLPQAVEVDIQIAYTGKNTASSRNRDTQREKRRLVQSFAIPCKAADSTSSGTGTSGTTSSGGGATGDGASGGGATPQGAAP